MSPGSISYVWQSRPQQHVAISSPRRVSPIECRHSHGDSDGQGKSSVFSPVSCRKGLSTSTDDRNVQNQSTIRATPDDTPSSAIQKSHFFLLSRSQSSFAYPRPHNSCFQSISC